MKTLFLQVNTANFCIKNAIKINLSRQKGKMRTFPFPGNRRPLCGQNVKISAPQRIIPSTKHPAAFVRNGCLEICRHDIFSDVFQEIKCH